VCHHVQLVLWDSILLTFLPMLTSNLNLPISASQVAGVTGISTMPRWIIVLNRKCQNHLWSFLKNIYTWLLNSWLVSTGIVILPFFLFL
jgi:hypothetical protein